MDIEEVYLHCGKALIRSKLWDPASQVERTAMPTMGRMVADQVNGIDSEEVETNYQNALKTRLY